MTRRETPPGRRRRTLMRTPHLVYLRRSALATATPDALAAACGISRADACRVLKSKVPQAVRVEESAEAAGNAVAELRARGLDAFHTTLEAARHFAPTPVTRAEPREPGLIFRTGETRIEMPAARMIVLGKIHSESRRTTRTELSACAGLAAGYLAGAALPLRGTPQEATETRRQDESFCCVIQGARDAVVLRETVFDYKATLPRIEPTRERSFGKVVEMARAAFPQAAFDDRLYKYPAAVRMLGEARVRGGGVVDMMQSVESGSTAVRSVALAWLLYLELFGPDSGTAQEQLPGHTIRPVPDARKWGLWNPESDLACPPPRGV